MLDIPSFAVHLTNTGHMILWLTAVEKVRPANTKKTSQISAQKLTKALDLLWTFFFHYLPPRLHLPTLPQGLCPLPGLSVTIPVEFTESQNG